MMWMLAEDNLRLGYRKRAPGRRPLTTAQMCTILLS